MECEVLIRLALASLATWRVSFLLAREEGPLRLIARMRQSVANTFLGRLLTCVKCVSLWVAIPFAFFVGGDWTELAVVWLALSGVASLIDEATRPPFELVEGKGDELLREPNGDDH